ncbi:hypothetical protein NLG97_g6491 [Lecanicillium saksenae]|uniref:Uncharacterized protein n=1 Tax=Lecanicillium saksenae TaxID=468837 RepID=A0ACC1QPI6_9HYPO|nr:hypothetical protein NLG97_g6491 [Lecanicillium saksenae]
MSLIQSLTAALLVTSGVQATDLSQLPSFLKQVSTNIWPALKDISVAIYHDPEVGLDEHLAHDRVVRHFHGLDDWTTKPSAFGMSTAFEMSFEHIPKGYKGPVNTIGFLAEYDALVGVGHACGHNHIVLNGMTAAILTSQALQHFDIPGRVKLVGCPDEEFAGLERVKDGLKALGGRDTWGKVIIKIAPENDSKL